MLRFEAVTHQAAVYVEGKLVATHVGGYTPFEVELTDFISDLTKRQYLTLTVKVNNELSYATMPPGEVITNSAGHKKQVYFHDFFNYAGIHRSVYLYTTNQTYISDITVTTQYGVWIGCDLSHKDLAALAPCLGWDPLNCAVPCVGLFDKSLRGHVAKT